MITETEPKGFKASFGSTGIYIIHDGKALFLKRKEQDDGFQGTWGTPGGKIDEEAGETPEDNIIREVMEETGINIERRRLVYALKSYVTYPKYRFTYHIFTYSIGKKPRVVLSDEHSEFLWIRPDEALKLRLILDEDWCIKKAFGIKQ